MTLRRLITVLVAAFLALPLVGGNALRCMCDPLLMASTEGGGCCCKGAHEAADQARATGQDAVHRACCCDSVDGAPALPAATVSHNVVPAELEDALAFAPLAPAFTAERQTAALLPQPVPPLPGGDTGGTVGQLRSVRLRP